MENIGEKYPEFARVLRAAIETAAERFDVYGCGVSDNVHEIPSRSFDGFIAHTNGGFRCLVPCTLRDVESEGLSGFESDILEGYIRDARRDAASDYIKARPILADEYENGDGAGTDTREADEWLAAHWEAAESEYRARYFDAARPELPGIEPAPGFEASPCGRAIEAERQDYWEFSDEYLSEGGTFFYEITAIFYAAGHRRNVTGADEVYIFAGINTDFEYGRERGLECAIERTYKIARLTAERLETILSRFVDKIL